MGTAINPRRGNNLDVGMKFAAVIRSLCIQERSYWEELQSESLCSADPQVKCLSTVPWVWAAHPPWSWPTWWSTRAWHWRRPSKPSAPTGTSRQTRASWSSCESWTRSSTARVGSDEDPLWTFRVTRHPGLPGTVPVLSLVSPVPADCLGLTQNPFRAFRFFLFVCFVDNQYTWKQGI